MPGKFLRIILDTNLWISFLLNKEVIKLDNILTSETIQLLFSEELLEEFLSVTKRPKLKKYFLTNDVNALISSIETVAEFIKVKSHTDACRDAKDNFLLNLATDGKADLLITGDKDLLVMQVFQQTRIVTFTQFLSDYGNEQ